MNQSERVVKNECLQEVINIAKQKGYKVYTHESTSSTIEQIFIEAKDGRIGSCSTYYGGIRFYTIHKSDRGSGNGSGFGKLINGQDFDDPKDIDICFTTYPYWSPGHIRGSVYKFKSFQEYVDQEKILKYFEL